MSSSDTVVADPSTITVPSPVTFWCHECDMSVSLFSPSPPLCPHCHSLFLEHMDHLPPPEHHRTLISLTDSDSDSDDDPSSLPPTTNPNPNPTAYLHRLIQNLAGDDLPLPFSRGPFPASQSSIDALPVVPVAEPSLLCAVCKDDFPLGSPARKLPCSHLYHSDCIVPWLSVHNSCPLCRSPLASDPSPAPTNPHPLRGVFRHTTRRQRHRILFPTRQAVVGEVMEVDMAQEAGSWWSSERLSYVRKLLAKNKTFSPQWTFLVILQIKLNAVAAVPTFIYIL